MIGKTKKNALNEKYVSEDTKKNNLKKMTKSITLCITITAIYIFGYVGSLIASSKKSLSVFEALNIFESRFGKGKILFTFNSGSLKGIFFALLLGLFIYFVISVDNERHYTTNMETSAGSGGFMPKEQKKAYDEAYKKPDPPTITDYNSVDLSRPWEEIKCLYSQNMINSWDFVRPMDSRELIGNNNVLIVGGAGTGKSRFYIKPNVLQMNASFIITDPSGEMIASLGNVLVKNGYKIKIFNISNKRYSNTYNPLKYIRNAEDVNILITCLIDNTTKGEGAGENQFFVDAEKLLYSACIFYLVDFCPDESKKNFAGVMDMIISSNVDERNADSKSDLDKLFDKLPKSSLASKYYRAFKQAAGKTLKSIIISCVTRLQPFLIPQIQNLTKTDELELDKIGNERTALFIITPQADRTYSFLASILYSQLFMTLYDVAEKRKASIGDERLPIPVRCMMDEFANIGTVPAFDEKLATMRKYNISATVVLQNISQIEAMYQEKYRTIIGNCTTNIFLGSSEKEVLEYYSALLGDETIRTKSTSNSNGGKSGSSISYSNTSRTVLKPDELGRLDPKKCITFTQNLRPVLDDKYKYEQHPYYSQTGDADPKNNFSYIVSAFDNFNVGKYENMIAARTELRKYRQTQAMKPENAKNKKVKISQNKDELFNSIEYSPEEKKKVLMHYETALINDATKSIENGDEIVTARIENMPTKFIGTLYKRVKTKLGIDKLILFANTQSKNDTLLGYIDKSMSNLLNNNVYVVDKQPIACGDYMCLVGEDDYYSFIKFINEM